MCVGISIGWWQAWKFCGIKKMDWINRS